MADPLEELKQIAKQLGELETKARAIELHKTLKELETSALQIGQAWSKSWFGYQANVYYRALYGRNIQIPPKSAYFNNNQGLSQNGYLYKNPTTPGWHEYKDDDVLKQIYELAGDPDTQPIVSLDQETRRILHREKQNILSIIDIELSQSESTFLLRAVEDLDSIKPHTPRALIRKWAPTPEYGPQDVRACQGGVTTPPHISLLAWTKSIRSAAASVTIMADIGRKVESHTLRRRPLSANPIVGNRTFIGHGHSADWRKLKDFIENRLGLPADEFNRVSTAGIPTIERLEEMLEKAGFAFLVMTGEDQQTDGNLRARENVVHEVGLFQGKLGFKKAIVLLEEDCEEFSNITGLGQIRFPKGNINAAFEEIRLVLEREGFISGLVP